MGAAVVGGLLVKGFGTLLIPGLLAPVGHLDQRIGVAAVGGLPEQVLPVRWGRLATTRPDTPCETWGRPDLVQLPGRAVDTAHLTQHPPQADGDGLSPRGGLSGAALFCGRLLTGGIAADPARHAHAALEAVPAYVLLHDPGFRNCGQSLELPQECAWSSPRPAHLRAPP
ncbi:hypothetical protein [Streptomyces cellulosae]|uniref:hypothetical protein n=1 Tax=Streptomyces cellulosae TaxID=1968 RepID=UPI0004C5CEBD|nr:hypothetical protein [Streptomyces cellulosae]